MACPTGCGGSPGDRRWVAVSTVTGDCLVTNPDGSCRRFKTRGGALAAAEAIEAPDRGAMRV